METLDDKLEELNNEIIQRIGTLLEDKGVPSETQSQTKVLKVEDEDVMFNLESLRYLVEINETKLIDSSGYEYNLDVLSVEQLCEVVDSLSN